MSDSPELQTTWFVYALVSDTITSTYVGVSTAVERRLAQHNGERPGGARSTRRGRPWRIGAICGPIPTRSEALKLEHRIKQLDGPERVAAVLAYAE